ncbi:MAG: hypothetical protein EXR21_06285 [Flavobacteriaceae bacterium]|nr:hypothetical protein [Flavobacteriaceae bacterium]
MNWISLFVFHLCTMYQRNFLFIIVLLATISLQAQSTLPRGVKMNFEVMYSSKKAKWNQDSTGWWQAKFKLNKKVNYARYDAKGHWLNTMEELPLESLPEGLNLSIKENWGSKIVSARKGFSPFCKELYELTIQKDNITSRRLFTPEGLAVQ